MNPAGIPPEEERFFDNTKVMGEAILDGVKKLCNTGYNKISPLTIEGAMILISAYDKHVLIRSFIENSHEECWDMIKKRDEGFFINNAGNIFKKLNKDKVDFFKELFISRDANGNPVISQSLKDQIWDIFDSLIKISIKYVHKHRNPYSIVSKNDEKVIQRAYGTPFYDDVDIGHHVRVWNMTLDFPLRQ